MKVRIQILLTRREFWYVCIF